MTAINKDELRIVFMGTPEFAVQSLKILVENDYNIIGVITSPDKPAGRGRKISQSDVKKYAVEQNLNILQPEKLKDPIFIDELKSLNANLQVVVAFRMLPEVVWNMPEFGTFNLHSSLLPNYRGAAPINRVIINGESETGITTFFLKHEIDTGNIILQEKIEIDKDENAGSLHDRLMLEGAVLVKKTVETITKGNYKLIDQVSIINEKEALKSAPKIFKEDCKINWSSDINEIYNLIRGLSPYPAAWTNLISPDEKVLQFKVFVSKFEESDHNLDPGSIFSDSKSYIKVAVLKGFIYLHDIQVAGKKRMRVEDFLRGFKIDNGFRFA